jgi:hypothetical protein
VRRVLQARALGSKPGETAGLHRSRTRASQLDDGRQVHGLRGCKAEGMAMKQTIEVEIKPAVRCWVAVVRRNGVWILQAQAASESEATQEIYLRLRELRDGIDAVIKEL